MRPRRGRGAGALAVATALAVTTVVTSIGEPVSADTIVTVSGTEITVESIGNDTVTPGCAVGVVTISGAATSPAVACGSLTLLRVTGNAGSQKVDGRPLDAAPFAARPTLEVALGAGSDAAWETGGADVLDLGANGDTIYLRPTSTPNTTIAAGTGDDWVVLEGTAGDYTLTAASAGASVTVAGATPSGTGTHTVSDAELVTLDGGAGDDTLDLRGITSASTLATFRAEGGPGNDTLWAGAKDAQLRGGTGTNRLVGGPRHDQLTASSSTDTIEDGTGRNLLYDQDSPFSGGRTVTGSTGTWMLRLPGGDNVTRIRPGPDADRTVTTSLTRPGQQVLPDGIHSTHVFLANSDAEPDDRGLVDVVASDRYVYVDADEQMNDLIDITVPTGTWTKGWTGELVYTVDPTDEGIGSVSVHSPGPISVHGPWTDLERGFVHRATRDLVFRFADEAALNAGQAALEAGTTRPAFVGGLMDTDEYRGLDVDRVFTKYLRRKADPGGRTYWISSIRNGKALWRFRAQLFGSNEYFTKVGGTNAAYVAQAYIDVLGRAPDPSGQAYWTRKLDDGGDRGSVALQFINSPESRRRLVDDQFLRFLDRKPTAGEQATWVAQIPTAGAEQRLIAHLAATNEYFSRT